MNKIIEAFKNLFFGASWEKNKLFIRICGGIVLFTILYFIYQIIKG